MYCYTQCPWPCSRTPPTHASTRDSWTLPCQSLMGSLLLSPGSWCIEGSVCAQQESISQSCVSSGSSMVGIMATSSKRAYVISRSAAPRAPAPWQATADLYLHRRHSDTVLSQSLGGLCVLVHTRLFWALWTPRREWGLILNANSPLLPSCWVFSFAFGCGVSPHGRSSAVQPPLKRLTSCWDFSALGLGASLTVAPGLCSPRCNPYVTKMSS